MSEPIEYQTLRSDIVLGIDMAQPEVALEIINKRHARKPLAIDDVYLFPADISSQRLDSYKTRMAESSLGNYRQDVIEGVPLMNSHRTHSSLFGGGNVELPHGRSYAGSLLPYDDGITLRAWHYILRNWESNGVNSDDLIRGIDSGIYRDMSIGFRPGWYRCSVCNADMMKSEKCEHLPGLTYEGSEAYAWVEDARLLEASLVYKGATPNAAVVRKAQAVLKQGLVGEADIRQLEEMYETRILDIQTFTIPTRESTKRRSQSQEQALPAPDNREENMELEELKERWGDLPQVQEADNEDTLFDAVRMAYDQAMRELSDYRAEAANRIAELEAEVNDLQARAIVGDQYLSDLIEEAVASRVRVQADDFDAKAYREMLNKVSDPAYVKSEIRAWEAQAKKMFTPGRPTQPPKDNKPSPEPSKNAAHQYKV